MRLTLCMHVFFFQHSSSFLQSQRDVKLRAAILAEISLFVAPQPPRASVERLLIVCDHLQDTDYMIRKCRPRTQAIRRRKANAGDLNARQDPRTISTAYRCLDDLGQVQQSVLGNTIT